MVRMYMIHTQSQSNHIVTVSQNMICKHFKFSISTVVWSDHPQTFIIASTLRSNPDCKTETGSICLSSEIHMNSILATQAV